LLSWLSRIFPGLVVPGLVVPGLIVPGLVVPGLVVPGLVVPGLVVPASVGVPNKHIKWSSSFLLDLVKKNKIIFILLVGIHGGSDL
jgi:hypothetical protein